MPYKDPERRRECARRAAAKARANWNEERRAAHVAYMAAYRPAHYEANRDDYIARACAWQLENRDRKAEYDKRRRADLTDSLKAYEAERRELAHRLASKREWSRKRKMAVEQATPSWVTSDDEDVMRSLYALAVIYGRTLGEEFHVDHIVPLHGADVCGLHVPSNLQVIPAAANIRKRNLHFEINPQVYSA